MFIKKSLIGLVGLLVLVGGLAAVMPLVSRGQGNNPIVKQLQPRKFYLTPTDTYNGSQALTACASGYHMASLWEIFDTSNLRYDTQLGFTLADSGSGPPSDAIGDETEGWIRTGGRSASSNAAGETNCFAYTSSEGTVGGTVVELQATWFIAQPLPANTISPWLGTTEPCSQMRRVWCVQD